MAGSPLTGIDWGTQLGSTGVTYYFQGASDAHDSPIGTIETAYWSDYEIQQVRLAFDVYESITNLSFTEVDAEGAADIVLMNTSNAYMSGFLGVAGPPGTSDAGQALFNFEGTGWDWLSPGTGGLEQGGYGFVTIIHELGHAMGLAHPHDDGGTSTVFTGVTSSFNDYGAYDLNQGVFTTMSYNDGWRTSPNGAPPSGGSYGFQGTMMAFDIAVLQEKYGANTSFHTGADTYALRSVNGVGAFYGCIWDAGGTDQIVYNGSAKTVIDLHQATLVLGPGAGGRVSYVSGIHGGFTIAHGVVIENATGGQGSDRIAGNSASNRLVGRAGNDVLDGGNGDDVLTGGRGLDRMNGGLGKDVFDFNSKLDGHVGPARDVVIGFQHGQQDRIDLMSIDAFGAGGDNAFQFIGADSFAHYKAAHPGHYGMVRVTATNIVQIDIGGDRHVDMEIRATGSHLHAADFFL